MSVKAFLREIGCKERRSEFSEVMFLDGFDAEFYLVFNVSEDTETPEAKDTCDICIVEVGDPPIGSENIRLVANANKQGVMRFLFALGVNRFSEKTRKAMYTSPLRRETS